MNLLGTHPVVDCAVFAQLPAKLFSCLMPRLVYTGRLVYRWCMSRTNLNIDDEACAEVMRRYRLSTKREAVNFALRALAAEPFGVDEARRLRGSGWEGDLDEMRTGRS